MYTLSDYPIQEFAGCANMGGRAEMDRLNEEKNFKQRRLHRMAASAQLAGGQILLEQLFIAELVEAASVGSIAAKEELLPKAVLLSGGNPFKKRDYVRIFRLWGRYSN